MRLLWLFLFFCEAGFSQLVELKNFGENPGSLNAYIYVPKSISNEKNVPLVVALHGCSQTAHNIAEETGWNTLAEKHGFIVLYPEQKIANNASRCFNWFSKKDIKRNGESKSIKNMIDHVIQNYAIEKSSVHIYGLSAGGALTAAMLAQYPDQFQSGAVLAGGAYGLAKNAAQAYKVMKGKDKTYTTPKQLAGLVQDLLSTEQSYPKLIVLYGTEDKVVHPKNSEKLILQWIGLNPNETFKENIAFLLNGQVTRKAYLTQENKEYIIEYKLSNFGHFLPVDPGTADNQGGKIGQFSKAIGFFSTYYIARDMGLMERK